MDKVAAMFRVKDCLPSEHNWSCSRPKAVCGWDWRAMLVLQLSVWPGSSVGRAEDWKSLCRWFDSAPGHQNITACYSEHLLFQACNISYDLSFAVAFFTIYSIGALMVGHKLKSTVKTFSQWDSFLIKLVDVVEYSMRTVSCDRHKFKYAHWNRLLQSQ